MAQRIPTMAAEVRAARLGLTEAQRTSVERLFARNADGAADLDEFYERVTPEICGHGAVLVSPWCGMTVGVEPDGYTHS